MCEKVVLGRRARCLGVAELKGNFKAEGHFVIGIHHDVGCEVRSR